MMLTAIGIAVVGVLWAFLPETRPLEQQQV